MRQGRSLSLALACLTCLTGTAKTQKQDVFRDPSLGYSVARPGADWEFRSRQGSGDTTSILELYPKTSKGTVQASIRTTPVLEKEDSKAGGGAKQLLELALARVQGKPQYSAVETLKLPIAGHKAPGLSVRYRAGKGQIYRIQQLYLVQDGMRYILQCHAPDRDFEDFAADFEKIRSSFRLLEVGPELRQKRRLLALAAKCGSEIDWAESWTKAAATAKQENKLVLVVVRRLPGFRIANRIRYGPLMDPDVIGLVGERFVPYWLDQNMSVPFKSQASYGMSATTFGSAMLLVTAKGCVIEESACMQTQAVHAFLLESLARHPEYLGLTASRPADKLAQAEWHLRRGEQAEAETLLAEVSSARGHGLRAALYRQRRQGKKALVEIGKSRELASSKGQELDYALAEIVILLRMGKIEDARQCVDQLLRDAPEAKTRPAFQFYAGVCALETSGTKAARKCWQGLVDGQPESRWAHKAAALLLIPDSQLGRGLRLAWPTEELLQSLRSPERERLPISSLEKIEAGAIDFLLRAQRPDGSWISPSEVTMGSTERPNPFVDAITSLCGRALLQRREVAGALPAVQRAIDFVLASHDRARRLEARDSYMDYEVWSKSLVLWFLADCRKQKLELPESTGEIMAQLVADLGKKQKSGGGWSYYVTRDLRTAGTPANQSISFTTAAVLMALLAARSQEVEVPEEMTEEAIGCLLRMRSATGAFVYMLQHGTAPGQKPGPVPPVSGACRGPVCELALFEAGHGSMDRIRKAVATFVEHREALARQLGKVLMHAGPQGQGCHYLMFDYAFAAAALRRLPPEERSGPRQVLLDLLLEARSREGSYLDTAINGWAYGTAMALMAFHDLEAED